MPVHIVTDSAADISPERAAELGVTVVPLTIRFGAEEFTDGVELTPEAFYAKMATFDGMPETAAPSPGTFEAAIRAASTDGDPVVVINISSDLSATMASAENAARAIREAGDGPEVHVVDSKSITATLGLKVVHAAEAAASGASAEEVVALVEELRTRSRVYGALSTLDNLKKGGRIGGAQAMLGSVLSIKPIIDISNGSVSEAGKVRTRRKSLVWLRDRIFELPKIDELALCSGGADDVDELLELIAERYSRDEVQIWTIGPVIGTHGGPGVIGFAWHDPS
ncbi:DegV family protein [Aquihabitans sp. G128]|uniref:DegV family protein n=1 Tax=Aquihabitans sp. G128 TaxID=2849779 RepID=UPI001C239481|nr:DegV family protein [Aquihabitans sp. G128]QXC59835.1 DegV family protein [Aquihabitans sp. G128]